MRRRRAVPTILRLAMAIVVVGLFLAWPWPADGSTTIPVDRATLDSVAPANSSAVAFEPSNSAIALTTHSDDAARVDLLHTAYPFTFQSGAEVLQAPAPPAPAGWHWVSVDESVPSGGTQFEIHIDAGNGTRLDIESVEVSDASNSSDILFRGNLTNASSPWSISGQDLYGTFGSPPLRGLQVTTVGTQSGDVALLAPVRIPPSVSTVSISGFVQFNGTSGPFKIALDVQTTSGTHLAYLADWGDWSGFAGPPTPLALTVWSAALPGSVVLNFEPTNARGGNLDVSIAVLGAPGPVTVIGTFADGQPVYVSIGWDPGRSLALTVASSTGPPTSWIAEYGSAEPRLRALIAYPQLTVSASAQGTFGFSSLASLTNATVTFAGRGAYASLGGSPVPVIAGAVAGVAVAGLLAPEWLPGARSIVRWFARIGRGTFGRGIGRFVLNHAGAITILALAIPLYAEVALAFGGHPYDQWVFKSWVYAAQQGGIRGIYIQPEFVGDAVVRGDIPWSTLGFAYGPLCASLFDGLAHVMPPLAGFTSVNSLNGSVVVEAEIKTLLGLFTIATGAALYAGIRAATGRTGLAAVGLVVLVLNPAIVFDSVVWGETDSVLYLLFVLFALAATYRPGWAMAIAGLAIGFKETGPILLFPAALLVLAPGLGLADRFRRVAIAGAVLLVVTLPVVAAGLLPSVLLSPYTALFGNFVTGNSAIQPFVTPETYTMWTLFTGHVGGSGLTRLMIPSSTPLVAGASFSALGIGAFALTWLGGLVVARRVGTSRSFSFWLLATAFGAITFTALLTGTGARYYTLAIPGLTGVAVLAWSGGARWRRWVVSASLAVVTAISFWTMLGLFTVIEEDGYPIRGLGLSYNPIARWVSEGYANNTVISLGSIGAVALVAATAFLLVHAALPRSPVGSATAPPSSSGGVSAPPEVA